MSNRWAGRFRWLAAFGGGLLLVAWPVVAFGTQRSAAVEVSALTVAAGSWLIALVQHERRDDLRKLENANAALGRRVADRTNALARRIRDADLVGGVVQALADARLDPVSTMRAVADRLAGELGDVCVVAQLADDRQRLLPVTVRSRDPELADAVATMWRRLHLSADGTGLTAKALATRRAVRASGGPQRLARVSHPAVPPLFAANGVHSVLVAPMHAGDELVGALTLLRGPTPSSYDAADEGLVQDLADRAGIALVNARLHVEVREREQRFHAAFDEAPVGMALADLDTAPAGRYLQVNAALCRLTGYPQEYLVGKTSRAITHPDDVAGDEPILAGLTEGSLEHHQGEKRLLHADGHTVWVRVSASVVGERGKRLAVVHLQDITARKQDEVELAQRALLDPLTGLANRHLLMDHIRLALQRLKRHRGRVTLFYLDLDGFKIVNDTHGHEAGDRVLVEVAARLGAVLRGDDTLARIGGDEFVVVCPDIADTAAARRLAGRLAEAVGAPIPLDDRTLYPHTSVGIAVTGDLSTDPRALLHRADIAMYAAKRRGRGRVEMYRRALERPDRKRAAVEADLRAALDGGWLRLAYQPVTNVSSGRIVAAEALLRIEHPERGMLTPDAFIDVAEDSDLIVPIEEWVLAEACGQVRTWQQFAPVQIAVNLSGRQLGHAALDRRVLRVVNGAGINPELLCLEMTERVLIDADDTVMDNLRRLSRKGVRLAIDDFGTGYSSLAYLQQFPIDTLKIDRTFVAGLGHAPRDEAIVGAVTALGQALNLTVVAEGVETARQLQELRRLRCSRAQGFFLARPGPAEAVTDLLRRGVALPENTL